MSEVKINKTILKREILHALEDNLSRAKNDYYLKSSNHKLKNATEEEVRIAKNYKHVCELAIEKYYNSSNDDEYLKKFVIKAIRQYKV